MADFKKESSVCGRVSKDGLICGKLTIKDKDELVSWSAIDNPARQNVDDYARFVEYGLLEEFEDMWKLCHLYAPFEELEENEPNISSIDDLLWQKRLFGRFCNPNSKNVRLAYRQKGEDEILGVAILEYTRDVEEKENYVCVHHLIVNPMCYNRGVGSAMLVDLEKNVNKYCDIPVDTIYYKVDKENLPCIQMLEKYGFAFDGMGTNSSKYLKYKFDVKEKEK